MADFEQFNDVSAGICTEIERKLIALNIDWHDETGLRALAREALSYDPAKGFDIADAGNPERLARLQLYGLVGLMLKTMEGSAQEGREIHGSDAWKAFAHALWSEKSPSSKPASQ